MNTSFTTPVQDPAVNHDNACALSSLAWSAVIGGAFSAVAVSVVLLMLGSGIGFAAISPWASPDFSSADFATGFTIKIACWLILMQWLSSALGGYMAGRLRNRRNFANTDEVFFRDTAHGFLAWAVATVFMAAVMSGGMAAVAGAGAKAATAVAAGAASNENVASEDGLSLGYHIDGLFRSAGTPAAVVVRDEAEGIVDTSLAHGSFTEADKAYLARSVAANTGLSQGEAEARVNTMIANIDSAKAEAQKAAEAAKKAGTTFSFFTFFSLMIGAFIASVGGALGGRHRDLY